MTLRILGKKNMTWCNPASFTDAPSLIAARRWFGCIPYSTARHWISLWPSSSTFMLLARISNLRSLCCIFQSLSMKRTIIANASPSLVFHQRSQKKHCWQLFRISQNSISFSQIMEMNSARWFRDVKRWQYFSRNGRKLSTLKRGIPAFSRVSTSSYR